MVHRDYICLIPLSSDRVPSAGQTKKRKERQLQYKTYKKNVINLTISTYGWWFGTGSAELDLFGHIGNIFTNIGGDIHIPLGMNDNNF